jgi:hypothetical protein
MLFVLLLISTFHKMGSYGVETDFYWAYAPDAARMASGELPREPGVGPGYGLFLALFHFLFRDWFVSGKLLSIVSASAGGFFTFKFFRDLFDGQTAFYTLVLWHFVVMPFSVVASTDVFVAMLVAASLAALYNGGRISTRNLILSAVLMGYAYLTRPNAIALPMAVVFIVLFLNPGKLVLTSRLRLIAYFVAAFVVINLPWNLVQLFVSGEALRSDSYLIIASHFYGDPGIVSSEDMKLAAEKFDSLWGVVFYDFRHFVKHYVGNIYRHTYDVLLQSLKFPLFLFSGAGLFLLLPRLTKLQISVLLFPLLSFLLLCLVHYEPRYYLYIISFYIYPAVYFFFFLKETGSSMLARKVFPPVAFAASAVFVVMFSVRDIRATIADEPRALLDAATAIEHRVSKGKSIIARKPHLGYLTNLQTKYFPLAKTIDELLDYARKEKADYLLYSEIESKMRPELNNLLEPDTLPEVFELLYLSRQTGTVVYKLRMNEQLSGS